MKRGVSGALLLLPLLAVEIRADEEPVLRFDPFAMPDLAWLAEARPGHDHGDDSWAPVLRATLVSRDGQGSLANLGGVVLRVGEETEGYRLLAVREWEADFERAGERLTLARSRVAGVRGITPPPPPPG